MMRWRLLCGQLFLIVRPGGGHAQDECTVRSVANWVAKFRQGCVCGNEGIDSYCIKGVCAYT